MTVSDHIEYLSDHLVIRRLKKGTNDKRVICFPPSGSNSVSFKALSNKLSDEFDIWAVDPPGHGLSCGELLTNVDAMTDFYFKKLQTYFIGEFSLIGQSLGGLIAYNLAAQLEAHSLAPRMLTICATHPPHRIKKRNRVCEMPDVQMVEHLVQLNGIPASLVEHPKLLNLYLPAIRSDLYAYEHFDLAVERKYRGKTLVIGGTKDALSFADQMCEWDKYCPDMTLRVVEGDHFFVQNAPELISDFLNNP